MAFSYVCVCMCTCVCMYVCVLHMYVHYSPFLTQPTLRAPVPKERQAPPFVPRHAQAMFLPGMAPPTSNGRAQSLALSKLSCFSLPWMRVECKEYLLMLEALSRSYMYLPPPPLTHTHTHHQASSPLPPHTRAHTPPPPSFFSSATI